MAIELNVGRRVKAPFNWRAIISNSQQNCQILQGFSTDEYTALVRRARKTRLAQNKSDIVIAFLGQMRKKLYERDAIPRHSQRTPRPARQRARSTHQGD